MLAWSTQPWVRKSTATLAPAARAPPMAAHNPTTSSSGWGQRIRIEAPKALATLVLGDQLGRRGLGRLAPEREQVLVQHLAPSGELAAGVVERRGAHGGAGAGVGGG